MDWRAKPKNEILFGATYLLKDAFGLFSEDECALLWQKVWQNNFSAGILAVQFDPTNSDKAYALPLDIHNDGSVVAFLIYGVNI